MSSAPQTTLGRIEALTSLRFIAAFVVVCLHFGGETALVRVAPGIFTAGFEMVTLFFVLSGFVLTLAYAGKQNISTIEYFVNRIARIAPAYYLALAIVVLGSLSHGLANINVKALLLSATFLQAWVPPYPLMLNYPAWSLSVEMAFYLIFPFVLWVALRMRLRDLLLACLLLWLATQAVLTYWLNSSWYGGYPSESHDLLFFFPPTHLCSFLWGIYGARLLTARSESVQVSEFWSTVRTISICVLTLTVLAMRFQMARVLPVVLPVMGSLLSPLFLLLILQLSLGHDRWARTLSLAPFVALGQASYSFYILQVPIHRIFLKLGSPHLPDNPDIQFWTFVVVLTVASIFAQKFIESPASKFVRRLMPKKPPQSVPVSAPPAVTNNIVT